VRVGILRSVAAALESGRDALGATIASEAGKPLKAARMEVERASATFSAAAAALEAMKGEMLPLDVNAASLARWGVVKRVPLGPVLAITPFNFPLNLTAHKVAPAIAVGAPVVQKPASQTPLSALALQAIVREAGWPAEAYAVLPVPGRDAEGLVTDPRLPVVSFTGSGAVGWRLREIAPRKRVSLELGGNAAAVVHSDADLDDAAARVTAGAFGYAGQSCISVQRALVQKDVFDAFKEKLLAKTAALASGDPLDEKTDVGPMIAPEEASRAVAWIEEAVAGGARVLAGGTRSGSVVLPTILAGTSRDMKVESHEVFAPVVTLASYDTWDEALSRVNDSKYGLQAGIFTRDLGRIQRAFDVLEVGAILVNDVPTWRADRMPYGGVKESGIGREGPAYAMEEFTEPRLLVLRP
jgi:acyl-CoA reductase-like NAD-dependent aldehyde dehydrogenase